jgi:hypothetical protein
MDYIKQNHDAIAWILLWAWIALTIFIFAYTGSLKKKWYVLNVLLLAGFVYLKFLWKP